ncbi:MAG: hypothetical protein ACFB10_19175 [Salibacteraceae bacterium]
MAKLVTQLRISLLGCSEKINSALYDLMPEEAEIQSVNLSGASVNNLEALLQPDFDTSVIVVDLTLLPISQISTLHTFSQLAGDTPIIVLHAYNDRPIARTFLNNGAMGYLPINTNRRELEKAIDSVLSGVPYLSNQVGFY